MRMQYKPRGVCSRLMDIELEDGVIQDVIIEDGCDGNLQGISRLLKGMPAERAIELLSDIKCGRKNTSCPAQIAKALKIMINCQDEE